MLILALLSWSCQKDQLVEGGEPILFSSGLQEGGAVLSKADGPSASSSFLYAGSKFSLYGSWRESASEPATDIFTQQTVECLDGTAESWSYHPLRYWRNKGIYQFCAVYPYNATCEFGTGSDRLVIKYSMHADHYDLMAAKASVNLSGSSHPARVTLPFQHACAAVRFLFRNGVEDNETVYYLNSFELQNLQTMGVFIYDSDEVQATNWHPADARGASVFGWEANGDAFVVPDSYDDYSALDKPFKDWNYVIPQTLSAFGSAIPSVRFSVRVNNTSATPVYTTLSLLQDTTTTWEPGKLYTYYIRIQRSAISITMEVEPWDSYSVATEDINFG